jgi:hypothetical protein
MVFSKNDLYCLSWISDDYEEISHLKKCLLDNDNVDMSEGKVVQSLAKLISAKLAQVYRYDLPTQQYVETVLSKEQSSNQWFYITAAGVDFLKNNRDKIRQ